MGLFSKKTASIPVSSSKNSAVPFQPVAITGLGFACHAGDSPRSLISSILGQMNGTQFSDSHMIKPSDSSGNVPARIAPVVEFGDMPAIERFYQLATIALTNATAQLSADVKSESVLVVITVDSQFIMHLMKIDPQYLQSHLVENIPRLDFATFRILPKDTGSSTNSLRTSLAELNEGKWQAIIYGGADSLISMHTCQELNDNNRLYTVGKTEGIAPGEAAAFVVLQSTEVVIKNSTPALAYLRGVGVAAEPHAREADLEATEGLSGAISEALAQAGIEAADIQGIVHNLGAETVQSLEWYQTTQEIWPQRVDEQQRMALQMGEIEQADIPDDPIPKILLPYMTMGEVGAAALPMQLATALTWLEYDAWQARWGFPVRNHLLVCDTPEAPERGALVISTTLAETT